MDSISRCKKVLLIISVTFSLLFTLAVFCSAQDSGAQQYLHRLDSNKIEVKILTAQEIATSGITDPVLFDEIEKQLLQNYNRKDLSAKETDLMAWFCKDLASSGLKDYSTTLNLVADNSPNIRLRNYAKQSSKSLSMYTKVLAETQNQNVPNIDKQNTKILSMLKSGDIKLKTDAAKMVTRLISINNIVYDEIESQLLSDYKSSKNDKYFIDLMSWYCKALSSSGQDRYKPTIEKVFNDSDNNKLKKYARQSLDEFVLSAEKRQEIARHSEVGIDANSALIITKLESKYMLNKINAYKLILGSENIDPVVFKVVAQELSFGLTQQPVEEGYDDISNDINDDERVQIEWGIAHRGTFGINYIMCYEETMSLLCKALSLSGDTGYRQTLKEVIRSTDSGKIRRYAKQAYKKLNETGV